MATKALTKIWNPFEADGVEVYKWEGLATGDDGAPLILPHHTDKTVQILGTWDGATCVIEGSCVVDTPTWTTLVDPQGNAISKTADAIEVVLESPYQVRPKVTGGTTVDLDVYIVTKRT